MTNETIQTAVDILFDRIKLKADSIPMNNQTNRLIKGAYVDCLMLIREAKEMEKEQIMNAYNAGESDGDQYEDSSLIYYIDTYEKK